MRLYILFLALAALTLGSCTTAYKTGQTPDDVYYSPVRPQDEYVVTQQQDDRYYGGNEDYYTDRYLRMRLTNPYRWSALDDLVQLAPAHDLKLRNSDPRLRWPVVPAATKS